MLDFTAEWNGCEEAALGCRDIYIPCNKPATQVLHCSRDKRDYRMCDFCADHNIRRGMKFKEDFNHANA